MTALIEVSHVGKTYQTLEGKALEALRDISFSIGERRFVSIVGASGSGKTTLLQILAGLIPRSAGEIRMRGVPVDGRQNDIGFVFQQAVLLPWRTVLENLMLPVEVMGLERRSHRDRAHELLDLVGLRGFENKYPFELTGGMQQRVSISRALIYDPRRQKIDKYAVYRQEEWVGMVKSVGLEAKVPEAKVRTLYTNDLVDCINDFDRAKVQVQARDFRM